MLQEPDTVIVSVALKLLVVHWIVFVLVIVHRYLVEVLVDDGLVYAFLVEVDVVVALTVLVRASGLYVEVLVSVHRSTVVVTVVSGTV